MAPTVIAIKKNKKQGDAKKPIQFKYLCSLALFLRVKQILKLKILLLAYSNITP